VLGSWASAHHALCLAELDPELARAELQTLYTANRQESGLVSCERALDPTAASAGPLAVLLGEDGRSRLIGPPVAAFAVARLASLDARAARDLLAPATGQLDAIWSERLPPDTPLPVILHPQESGTPGSPLYDAMIDTDDRDEWLDDLATVGRSAAACQLDPARALRAGHPFVVEDPVFCGWFLLALEEMADAWERVGDASQEKKLRIRSEMIAEAMGERLWWEEEQIYVAHDVGRDDPLRGITAGGLLPAASRKLVQQAPAKRAIDRHLRPSASSLWAAHGISFNPVVADPSAEAGDIPWRGNVATAETHFWSHLALVRAQRVPDARVARGQLEARIEEQGFRAAYDPVTGEARGANDECTLPAIALAMRAAEDGA
jgi:hypothetical protein